MLSIKVRIEALTKTVRALYPECTVPYEELDPISPALIDVIKELDTPEKKAAYCELYNMQAAELENYIHALIWL